MYVFALIRQEGVIHDPYGDHIFIEPVLGYLNKTHNAKHPHLVYRRSAVKPADDGKPGCDIHGKVKVLLSRGFSSCRS